MRIHKSQEYADFEAGTHRVRLVSIEESERDFGDGKGLQARVTWTFADPDDPDRQVRGFSGTKLTQNSRLAQFITALAGVAFDRLPDALDVERLVGRTVIASVEVNAEGRSKVGAVVPDVTPKTAPKPSPSPQRAQRPPSPDFEEAVGDSDDDIPF